MISGMRVRRRSAFKAGGGYRFYRLHVTASEGASTQVRELRLVTEDFPTGEVSGGTASASSGNADSAFTYFGSNAWLGDPLPAWVQYEFPEPQEVTEYRITATDSSVLAIRRAPTSFTFEASKNGVAWDTLDSQSGLTWSRNETKSFPLT